MFTTLATRNPSRHAAVTRGRGRRGPRCRRSRATDNTGPARGHWSVRRGPRRLERVHRETRPLLHGERRRLGREAPRHPLDCCGGSHVSHHSLTGVTGEGDRSPYAEIVGKARAHFNPKPSPIVKRYEFNTRRQAPDESVNSYVAALRSIAEHCDYGKALSEMLRDRLVCGIYDKAVQRRLLQQPDLTFETALEVTLAAEAAEKDSKRLTGADSIDMHTSNSIGKVRDLPPPTDHKGRKPHESGPQQQSTARADCFRCGGKHEPSHCRFRAYECRHCKKKGHLARVCRKRGQ